MTHEFGFMTPEHVARMNELLSGSTEVRQACARLAEPVSMVQRLEHGPDGGPVFYAMTFTDTASFSLADVPDADIVLVGNWRQMIRAARAQREGRSLDPGMRLQRGAERMADIDEVFALARTVATVPVSLPEVDRA